MTTVGPNAPGAALMEVDALASSEPRRSVNPTRRSLRSEANRLGGRAFLRPPARPSHATNQPQRVRELNHQGESVRGREVSVAVRRDDMTELLEIGDASLSY